MGEGGQVFRSGKRGEGKIGGVGGVGGVGKLRVSCGGNNLNRPLNPKGFLSPGLIPVSLVMFSLVIIVSVMRPSVYVLFPRSGSEGKQGNESSEN